MKYKRLIITGITTIALVVLAIACAIGRWAWVVRHSVSRQIAERVALHDGKPIVLSELTAFEWDKVYFFGPYTSPAQIEQTIGFKWPEAADSDIQSSKGNALVVFVKAGRVVESFDQSRGQGDFTWVDAPNGLTPDEARFIVERRASDGWEFMQRVNADGRPATTNPGATTVPATTAASLAH